MDEVTLSPTAASDCIAACETYITGAQVLINSVQNTVKPDAFGTLGSGMALDRKFTGVAVGETWSLDTVLRQHIEVIQKLKAAFKTAGERYVETDQQNAAHLTAQQPK